jgi:RimJ/RimL family protein N-acetyltransferase
MTNLGGELRRLSTASGEIIIRRYEERDIPFHKSYVYDSPKEFLDGIGFDTTSRRTREEFGEFLKGRISETAGTSRPNALIAELNHRAVAIVPLDLHKYVDGLPRLHFHIFDPSLRGQGLGGPILKACAEELSKMTGFNKFMIEPKASNERMNRLMRKLGFRYVRDYMLSGKPGVQEMIVSQYEISIDCHR